MPKESLDIRQAKARLSRLVERAEAGEEIIISRDGKPGGVHRATFGTAEAARAWPP